MSEIGGKAKAVLFNYADWKLPSGKNFFLIQLNFMMNWNVFESRYYHFKNTWWCRQTRDTFLDNKCQCLVEK